MWHEISAKGGSNRWQEQFREIREAFVETLQRRLSEFDIQTIRCCNEDGEPAAWFFRMTDSALQYHSEGQTSDAEALLRNNMDQGMGVAIAGEETPKGNTLWITVWEPDEDAEPVWPEGMKLLFEDIHHGVRSKND